MNTKPTRWLDSRSGVRVRIALMLTLWAFAAFAAAADRIFVTFTNTTGVPAQDLHVTFTGTGGSVTTPPASVIALRCPIPAVPSNGQITNTVVIDWGMPCVQPGQNVTFQVSTPNGPLGVAAAFWTGPGGVVIGPAPAWRVHPIPPPPPPIIRPFWAIKVQTMCVPLGIGFYTPWNRPPGQTCWGRFCCFPLTAYYYRVVLARFVFRRGRFLEVGGSIMLTPWLFSHLQPPNYYWQFVTIRPENLGGHIFPPGGVVHNGPPLRRGWRRPWMQGMFARYSDDAGQTYRPGFDMYTSFFDVFFNLRIDSPAPAPPAGFSGMCQALAPGFQRAAIGFADAANELAQVAAFEPTPEMIDLQMAFNQLSAELQAIGADLTDGTPSIPFLYDAATLSLERIASWMPVLAADSPRFFQMQQSVLALADGMREAARAINDDISVPANQDRFLYVLFNRLQPGAHDAAMGGIPSMRVHLALPPRAWLPHMTDGASVLLTRLSKPGQPEEQMVLPVSETGTIDLPLLGLDEAEPIRLGVKVDGFVSTHVMTTAQDGMFVPLPPQQNGDVNGDDRVDPLDMASVMAAMGQGGLDAPEVGPEDLDFNGIVDFADLTIVQAGMGAEGAGWVEVHGNIDLTGLDGPREVELTDMHIFEPTGDHPLDVRRLNVAPDGSYSFATARSGLVRLIPKASSWLSSEVLATLPNLGGEVVASYVLRGGDVDGNDVCDIDDFLILASTYELPPGGPGYDPRADLTRNSAVDIEDFLVLAAFYEQSGVLP